jgi:hypothetical protein
MGIAHIVSFTPCLSIESYAEGVPMYKYDFALSFAGEDRAKAENLAKCLQQEKVRVFYDRDEEAELWGQDLYQKFQQIYDQQSRFFIPFVSVNYLTKRWPKHELKQAQARDFKSDVEYILPIRLDDSELPGLNDTTAYIDLRKRTIDDVAEICLRKLARNSSTRQLFLFLRESNPAAMKMLESRSEQLMIRVATSKAELLKEILSRIDFRVCTGIDHHNMFMNGGFVPPGCIQSVDPEPHTTFTLTLFEDFYREISA